MVVGEAEVVIVPNAAGFRQALEAETQGGLNAFGSNAKKAGEDAGRGVREGMNADQLAMDLGEAGTAGGRDLRERASKEAQGLGGDLEKAGRSGGERMSSGIGGGLSKLTGILSNVGVPMSGLTSKVQGTAGALESAGASAEQSGGAMAAMTGPYGIAAAAVAVVGVEALKMGEHMETAETKIASAQGTTVGAAKAIGAAFLDTAGKSEFSGEEMAEAFSEVAGQMKAVQGHALNSKEAMAVMGAASDLASAKQIGLGTATAAVSQTMQVFKLGVGDAAHVSDVLYNASTATGTSVDTLASQLARAHSRLGEMGGSVGSLSALLVDMAHQGITGRTAMSALNTAFNGLQKDGTGVVKAVKEQKDAMQAMSPQAKALAEQYDRGSLSSKDFKKASESLGPAQEGLVKSFLKGGEAVQAANAKYKSLGITVFNSQGAFVGMGSIIEQLHPKFEKMSKAQQLLTAEQIFGQAAAKQMVEVIRAGPAAYDKATQSTEKNKAAQEAARKQGETLAGEVKILKATFEDLAAKLGSVLIPALTLLGKAIIEIIKFDTKLVEEWIKDWKAIIGAVGSAVRSIVGAWKDMEREVSAAVKGIARWVTGAWHEVTSDTEELVHKVASFFSKLPHEILSTLEHLPHEMLELGEHIIDGIGEGIEKAAGSVLGKVEGFVNKAKHLLTHPWEALSPSRVTTRLGENIAEGLAVGMTGRSPMALAAATSMSQQIIDYFMEHGMTKAAAAGIAGNVAQESSYNVHDPGGGLFQFTPSEGMESMSAQEQMARVMRELKTGYRGLMMEMNKAGSPEEAANLFMKGYEKPEGSQPGETRPSQLANANLPHRERAAREAYGGGGEGGSNAAAEKERTERQVAQMKRSLDDWVAKMTAKEDAATKAKNSTEAAALKQQIALHKAQVMEEIAYMKAGATRRQAEQKVQAQQEVRNKSAGEKELQTLEAAISTRSATSLKSALTDVHHRAMAQLVDRLDKDHSSALKKMGAEIVAEWKKASQVQREVAADEAAKAAEKQREAEEKAADERTKREEKEASDKEKEASDKAAAIAKTSRLEQEQYANQAQRIADETKVTEDKAAETGLTGASLQTAKLQTALDEVTAAVNRQVGEAQEAETNTQGSGVVAEAEAAQRLAKIEGEGRVKEAEAQRNYDLASGKESTAGSTIAGEPSGSGSSGTTVFNIELNAAGMSAGELVHEIGWQLKTGVLPVAVPA